MVMVSGVALEFSTAILVVWGIRLVNGSLVVESFFFFVVFFAIRSCVGMVHGRR